MLIGRDDIISIDIITLGTCFSMFYARFRIALIGRLTAHLTGSHRGIGGGIQIPVM